MSRPLFWPTKSNDEYPLYFRVGAFLLGLVCLVTVFKVGNLLVQNTTLEGTLLAGMFSLFAASGFLFALPTRWRNRLQGYVFGALVLMTFVLNIAVVLK